MTKCIPPQRSSNCGGVLVVLLTGVMHSVEREGTADS
jgi:hypothetical protein